MKAVKHRIHVIGACCSFLFIAGFWISTLVAELFLSAAAVAAVKQAIVYALIAFVPTIAMTGASGFALAAGSRHPTVGAKRKRMPVIALNGLLVMVPTALFLNGKARIGDFDTAFLIAQTLELICGAANLLLIGLNIRDGLSLRRHRPPTGGSH